MYEFKNEIISNNYSVASLAIDIANPKLFFRFSPNIEADKNAFTNYFFLKHCFLFTVFKIAFNNLFLQKWT